MPEIAASGHHNSELLLSVAEQLKLPLLQIAREAELSQLTQADALPSIRSTADSALQLLDSFMLGLQLQQSDYQLAMEPVSVSAVLYDTSQRLTSVAKRYGVGLDIHIAGRYGTVMAHRQALEAALVSLGTSIIEALPAEQQAPIQLQLATHRCRYGIVAGLYAATNDIHSDMLVRGRKLQGKARQPLAGLTHTSGAGVFIADTILQAMQLTLKVSRHNGLHGFGVVLPANQQLQLV